MTNNSGRKNFIAIPLPKDTVHEICNVQRQLPANIELVEPDKFHLTVRFIGELNDRQETEIAEKIDNFAFEPFTLSLGETGVFNNFVTVVWLGISGDTSALRTLAGDIDHLVSPFAKTDSRTRLKFSPHITIGRSNQKINAPTLNIPPLGFYVPSVAFMQSMKDDNNKTVYRVI